VGSPFPPVNSKEQMSGHETSLVNLLWWLSNDSLIIVFMTNPDSSRPRGDLGLPDAWQKFEAMLDYGRKKDKIPR
jgi:hypothetical protein